MMKTSPKVSIVTITYNHELYLEAALKSFISQKVNFDYEIIIADDGSADNTPSIIKKYASRYPQIKPILREKNIGAIANSVDSLKAASGTYIALCEGDDFWTDNTKLQKQVDFLDSKLDYALCFHPVRVFFEDHKALEYIDPETTDAKIFTTNELIKRNFIQTCSVMYRRQDYSNLPTDLMPLDWYLHLYHASFGKIGFIQNTMAAYRRHAAGMWWGSQNDNDSVLKKYGLEWFKLYLGIQKIYKDDQQKLKLIEGSIITHLNKLYDLDEKEQSKMLRNALSISADVAELYVSDLQKQAKQLKEHSKKQAIIIQHYVDLSEHLEHENTVLKNKLLVRLETAVKHSLKRKKV